MPQGQELKSVSDHSLARAESPSWKESLEYRKINLKLYLNLSLSLLSFIENCSDGQI